MHVIVAEKPNQAADIAAALLDPVSMRHAGSYITGILEKDKKTEVCIVFAKGHLLELDIPEAYDPKWGTPWDLKALPIQPAGMSFRSHVRDSKCDDLIATIAGVCRRASEITNACDAGREGELIFWEIMEFIKEPRRTVKVWRLWIQDPTSAGISRAFGGRKPADSVEYQRMLAAARLRQQADWLYGTNLSRYVTLCLPPHPDYGSKTIRIGRVLTPTLGMIFDRTAAAIGFKEEMFYRIRLTFRGKTESYQALLVAPDDERFGRVDTMFKRPEFVDKTALEISIHALKWEAFDEVTPAEEFPPAPFSLNELQRACFRLFRWSAKYTLKLAQQCYQNEKSITYPRTKSWHLPDSMRSEAEHLHRDLWVAFVCKEFPEARRVAMPSLHRRYFKADKNMEDHHAIIPTGVIPSRFDEAGRPSDAYILWDLVTRRFILSLLAPAKINASSRVLTFEHPTRPEIRFRAILKAAPLEDPGWLNVEDIIRNTRGYGKALADRKAVKFPDTESLTQCLRIEKVKGYTERPPEFDEDTLLGAMESLNLGTAATRADIIEKLIEEAYIERRPSGFLTPKALGAYIVQQLKKMDGMDLLSPDLTAHWEQTFEAMELGESVDKSDGEDDEKAQPKPVDRVEFLQGVIDKAVEFGSRILKHGTALSSTVYCPKKHTEVTEDAYQYFFDGYKDVIFKKVYAGCFMSKKAWRDVLVANPQSGAGPFTFTGAKGPFEANLAFKPRGGKWGHFKLINLKNRQKK